MPISLADLRREYTRAGLAETDLAADPLTQFERWFQQATDAEILEPNAAVLATADSEGRPSARTILVKQVNAAGFTFFTSYQSRKARELDENANASLVFPWLALERQVIVAGTVVRADRAASAAYFRMRPRGSRLGACASDQSAEIRGREELERRLREVEAKYPGEDVPLPPHWGGFVLKPREVEFWQGRPSRLHDRLQYVKEAEGKWRIRRLAP